MTPGGVSSEYFHVNDGDFIETRPETVTQVTEVLPVGFVIQLPTVIPQGVRRAPLARIDVPPNSTIEQMPVVPFAFLASGGIARRQDGTPVRAGTMLGG